jgi:hypothetical protein
MTLMETAQVLGNFGEFFGAIVVFMTLAYLTGRAVPSLREKLHTTGRITRWSNAYRFSPI